MRASMASPSGILSERMIDCRRSPAKIFSSGSSKERKKRELPGSPWRPERPRNWLSMRRDSWRSEPMMCSPPEFTTWSWSFCHPARISAMRRSLSPSGSSASSFTFWMSGSGLPPSTMSVPRPAMLVAMVTIFGRPAWITISASRACCLALSTWCGSFSRSSIEEISSEFSIDVVPSSTGWPCSYFSFTSLMIAWYFSLEVMKTWSLRSLRTIGRWVGISTVSRL